MLMYLMALPFSLLDWQVLEFAPLLFFTLFPYHILSVLSHFISELYALYRPLVIYRPQVIKT